MGRTILSDLGYLCLRAVFSLLAEFFFNCVGCDITRGRRLVCEYRLVKFGGLSLLLGTYGDVLPLAVISHFILSKKEGLLQPKLGLQINLASTGTLSSAATHLLRAKPPELGFSQLENGQSEFVQTILIFTV